MALRVASIASRMLRRRLPVSSPPPQLSFLRRLSSSGRDEDPARRLSLQVAIVGLPNAGKSTLLNALLPDAGGRGLAATSKKRHTTRTDLLGLLVVGNIQFGFVDTPGFLRDRRGSEGRALPEPLRHSPLESAAGADLVLVVVDAARRISPSDVKSLQALFRGAAAGRPEAAGRRETALAVVLNKVDLVRPKTNLLRKAEEVGTLAHATREEVRAERGGGAAERRAPDVFWGDHVPLFMVSALKDDGVGLHDVLEYLTRQTHEIGTPGWEHDEDVTDLTDAERVAEIVREKLYRFVHKEVPHQVRIVGTEDTSAPLWEFSLVCRRPSQKKILDGRGGSMLERIRSAAAKDLARAGLGEDLMLHVRVGRGQNRGMSEDFE